MEENTKPLQTQRQDSSSVYRALTKQELEELHRDAKETSALAKQMFAHLGKKN